MLRIPDLNFSHPGSKFFTSRIRIKEFKYLKPKNCFQALIFYPSRIQGSKKAPDPGSATPVPRSSFQSNTPLPSCDCLMYRVWSVRTEWGLCWSTHTAKLLHSVCDHIQNLQNGLTTPGPKPRKGGGGLRKINSCRKVIFSGLILRRKKILHCLLLWVLSFSQSISQPPSHFSKILQYFCTIYITI